jgi:hypothetical protein
MSTNKISDSRDLSFQRIFNNMKSIAPDYKDKGVSPDLLFTEAGQAGGAIGDENDTSSNDMFKKISRIIPMQITDFDESPQKMTVTITIPRIIAPLCKSNLTTENVDTHARENPPVKTLGAEPAAAPESLMASVTQDSKLGSSRSSVASSIASSSASSISSGNRSVAGVMKSDSLFQLTGDDKNRFINSNYQETQKYIEE